MNIIQDFLKIINNRLTSTTLLFFSLIFCLVAGFIIGRMGSFLSLPATMTVVHAEGIVDDIGGGADKANQLNATNSTTKTTSPADGKLIFGSKIGKYFYYKGCGGDNLSAKNLVYYSSEAQAIASGKVLHDKCK